MESVQIRVTFGLVPMVKHGSAHFGVLVPYSSDVVKRSALLARESNFRTGVEGGVVSGAARFRHLTHAAALCAPIRTQGPDYFPDSSIVRKCTALFRKACSLVHFQGEQRWPVVFWTGVLGTSPLSAGKLVRPLPRRILDRRSSAVRGLTRSPEGCPSAGSRESRAFCAAAPCHVLPDTSAGNCR